MSFNLAKRVCPENKTSPLKAVSPIIRKYAGHRQKRIKLCKDLDNSESATRSLPSSSLRPILPKFSNGEPISIEPELLAAVSSTSRFAFTDPNIADDVFQPVQEICRLAATGGDRKLTIEKVAKSRKRAMSSAASKKKLQKHGKMLESALEILKDETEKEIRAKDDDYAENYFFKVRSCLTPSEFQQFCNLLEDLDTAKSMTATIFEQMSAILKPYPDLIQEFIPFLTAAQARDCGVFMEHLSMTKMTQFLSLLDTYFAKASFQKKKILSILEKFISKPNLDTNEVRNAIIPMLKGHSVLTDFFLELLPSSRPPEFLRTDFDEVDEEVLSDGSEEGGEGWERAQVPAVPDMYGGNGCVCVCHKGDNEKFRSKSQHCIPCSTKFINGKVFIQTGKLLRRAQISFLDHDPEYHKNRLFPGLTEPRKRKRSNSHAKDYISPTKTAQISSDEFKSDDDDKIKTRVKRFKKKVEEVDEQNKENEREAENVEIALQQTDEIENILIGCKEGENTGVESIEAVENDGRNLEEKSEYKDEKCVEKFELVEVEQSKKCLPTLTVSESAPVDPERKSPPVISIPESETVPAAASPYLSALEELTVKKEDDVSVGMIMNEGVLSNGPSGDVGTSTSSGKEERTEGSEKSGSSEVGDKSGSSEVDEKSGGSCESGSSGVEPWKMMEDKIILHTLQVELSSEETFLKISHKLPTRSVEDIKSRFQALLKMLLEMEGKSSNSKFVDKLE